MDALVLLLYAPLTLGGLLGGGMQYVLSKFGRQAWLLFLSLLCTAALGTGAVWFVGADAIFSSGGWDNLGAAIIGYLLALFALSGLVVSLVVARLHPVSPRPVPVCLGGAVWRCLWSYAFGTLLISAAVFLLGCFPGFAAFSNEPGIQFPVYAVLLAVLYLLVGFLLQRLLGGQAFPLAPLLAALFWCALLLTLGLLMARSSNFPDWGLSYVQSYPWGSLYARLNFPAAVCLGDYQYAVPGMGGPAPVPGSGTRLVYFISLLPPALFTAGWLGGRQLRWRYTI